MAETSEQIYWDENGLHLPPKYAYIGVAMDRRDAADEMQRAFDGARAAGLPCECRGGPHGGYTCDHCRWSR